MEFLNDPAVQSLIESQASLHVNRIAYNPEIPAILNSLFSIQEGGPTACLTDPETCKQVDIFTLRFYFINKSSCITFHVVVSKYVRSTQTYFGTE